MATLLLTHGAFQGGWVWQKTVPLLRARGHAAHPYPSRLRLSRPDRSPGRRPQRLHPKMHSPILGWGDRFKSERSQSEQLCHETEPGLSCPYAGAGPIRPGLPEQWI